MFDELTVIQNIVVGACIGSLFYIGYTVQRIDKHLSDIKALLESNLDNR